MIDRRVAVVGDSMLDRNLIGTATRVSTEVPVPVLQLREEQYSLGGAANERDILPNDTFGDC